jgi:AbrB family looped-hinge helix DNA binding protein
MCHISGAMAREENLVTLGEQGRLVIPANIRRELTLSPGEALLAIVEGERLVLEKRSAVLARLKARFSKVGPDVSLADELVAQRHTEASRDGE